MDEKAITDLVSECSTNNILDVGLFLEKYIQERGLPEEFVQILKDCALGRITIDEAKKIMDEWVVYL